MPAPQDGVFEFKTDIHYLSINGDIVETSKFKMNGDTLTLQKLSGISPCDGSLIGMYLAIIKDDKLSISVIDDACELRAMALPEEPMSAIKK